MTQVVEIRRSTKDRNILFPIQFIYLRKHKNRVSTAMEYTPKKIQQIRYVPIAMDITGTRT